MARGPGGRPGVQQVLCFAGTHPERFAASLPRRVPADEAPQLLRSHVQFHQARTLEAAARAAHGPQPPGCGPAGQVRGRAREAAPADALGSGAVDERAHAARQDSPAGAPQLPAAPALRAPQRGAAARRLQDGQVDQMRVRRLRQAVRLCRVRRSRARQRLLHATFLVPVLTALLLLVAHVPFLAKGFSVIWERGQKSALVILFFYTCVLTGTGIVSQPVYRVRRGNVLL